MRGRFISFEGGEGSGKSTQARLLADRLRGLGRAVVLTREPGGTPGAEALRALLVTGDAERWSPWAEACIVNAARADHVDRIIRPALARGDWVICDRYVDSTRAYQGAGKGLADADLCALHAQISGNLWPDLTLVLALPAHTGLVRAASRSTKSASASETRFEDHDGAFHTRVAAFFASLPECEPVRCHSIAADRSVAAIAADIAALVTA
jgi:dTMP kinase